MGKFCIFIVVILGVSVIDSRSTFDDSPMETISMDFLFDQIATATENICNMYGMPDYVNDSYCKLSQERLLKKIYKLRLEMIQLNEESPDDVQTLLEVVGSGCNATLINVELNDDFKKRMFNGRLVSNVDVIKGINANAIMIDMMQQCTNYLEIGMMTIEHGQKYRHLSYLVIVLGFIAIVVFIELVKAKKLNLKIRILEHNKNYENN